MFVFDFDGVIADTKHETYHVALEAFDRMEGRDLSVDKDFYQKLIDARPYVRMAQDIYVLIKTILEGKDFRVMGAKDLNLLISESGGKAEEFRDIFFETRKMITEKNYSRLFSLIKVYPCLIDLIKSLQKRCVVAISTAKNREATILFLEKHGVKMPEERVLDKDFSTDKNEHLSEFSKRFNVPMENIYFIDDVFFQIESVLNSGANILFADWGYSTEEQRMKAKEIGIRLLSLNNLKQQLMELI